MLRLISHVLCPYVQRAVIALAEKNVPFERVDVDLANKPDWFLKLSPLGKTPVLQVGDTAIFESAVILEYLEETQPNPLHPSDPLRRAEHRSWIEFSSAILNDIAGLYTAPDSAAFALKVKSLNDKFDRLEQRLGEGPFFDGARLSLVDAVFAPVFRYFDVIDRIEGVDILSGRPKLAAWRTVLAVRPSMRDAVVADYPARLSDFLIRRGSYISRLIQDTTVPRLGTRHG